MINATQTSTLLVPVKVLARTKPYDLTFSEGALRALIFKADDRQDSKGRVIHGNGLTSSGAILRVGRRVLIDVPKFDLWLLSHGPLSRTGSHGRGVK